LTNWIPVSESNVRPIYGIWNFRTPKKKSPKKKPDFGLFHNMLILLEQNPSRAKKKQGTATMSGLELLIYYYIFEDEEDGDDGKQKLSLYHMRRRSNNYNKNMCQE
jgi:hypothetical protein